MKLPRIYGLGKMDGRRSRTCAGLLLVAVCLLFPFQTASANVGVFGGFGSSLRLVEDARVQMVSERVEITLAASEFPVTGDLKHKDEALYSCRFKFRNLTGKKAMVKVGFPIEANDNFLARKLSPGAYKFRAKVDGKDADVSFLKSDADKRYFGLFVWDVNFPPDRDIEMEVSYRTYGYFGLGMTQDKPYYFKDIKCGGRNFSIFQSSLAQYYGYVVKTGKSWAGKIEKAEFIINVGSFERYLQKRGYLARDEKSPHDGKYEQEPYYNAALSCVLSPSGWVREGDNFVLRRSPFDASENILIRYDFTIIPTTTQGLDKFFDMLKRHFKESALEASDYKNICDVILEFYGVDTGNASIENFLKLQSWYKNKDRTFPKPPPEFFERLELYRNGSI